MAQKASGKGFENESHYQNMKSYFFAIENIHVMRSSLQKLIEGMVACLRSRIDSCFSLEISL